MNQQVQLLELLEIPQLLDTFTKNGYYEEAMVYFTHWTFQWLILDLGSATIRPSSTYKTP